MEATDICACLYIVGYEGGERKAESSLFAFLQAKQGQLTRKARKKERQPSFLLHSLSHFTLQLLSLL